MLVHQPGLPSKSSDIHGRKGAGGVGSHLLDQVQLGIVLDPSENIAELETDRQALVLGASRPGDLGQSALSGKDAFDGIDAGNVLSQLDVISYQTQWAGRESGGIVPVRDLLVQDLIDAGFQGKGKRQVVQIS